MDIGNKLRQAIAGATFTALLAACGGGGGGATVQHVLTVATAGTGTGAVSSAPAGINCGATCTASFDDGTSVALTAVAANGSVFSGWSGACAGSAAQMAVTVDAAKTCSANFAAMRALGVSLMGAGSGTVTGNPAGIACGATCSASHVDGTSVVLTAAPAVGSAFVQWGGDCAGTAATATVVLTAPRACTAQFEPVHTLTVTKAGSGGGTVSGNVGGINCGTACSADFLVGTNVTLTATAANGSVFAGWSGACSGTATTAAVTMSAGLSCAATFNAVAGSLNHTLTVTKSGTGSGTVTSAPAGINCGTSCSASFADSTAVTLTATATTGSTFSGWTGDCGGTALATTVTMSAVRACTAAFATATGSGLSDAGYHLLGEAGVAIAPTTTTTFANGTFGTSTYALHAVNVATGATTVVEAAGQWYPYDAQVVEASIDAAAAVIRTTRKRVTTYAKGGRLYKVDHISTAGAPTPQLWTTARTNDICSFPPVAVGAYNARHHFYYSPGADSICGTDDDAVMALPFGAGPADAPIAVSGRVLDTVAASNGNVTGYLAWNAGQIVRLDANLTSPVNLYAVPRAPVPIGLFPDSSGALDLWFFSDRGALRVLNLASGGQSAVSVPGAGVFAGGSYGGEPGALWTSASAGTTKNVVRIDTTALTGQIVGSFPNGFGAAYLTPTRIVVQIGNQIQSVPKSGGSPTAIASVAAPTQIAYHQVAGENVWFETRAAGMRRIGIVGSDGANLQFIDNAALQSPLMSAPSSIWWSGAWGAFTLLEGLSASGATAGTTLRTYDGASRSLIATHGTFPALPSDGIGSGSASPMQLGRHGLASFFAGSAVNLYLYKSDAAGFSKVTNY